MLELKSDLLYFEGDIWQDKMALSRPLMNFTKSFGSFRTFSTTARRFGGGEHATGTCHSKFYQTAGLIQVVIHNFVLNSVWITCGKYLQNRNFFCILFAEERPVFACKHGFTQIIQLHTPQTSWWSKILHLNEVKLSGIGKVSQQIFCE